MAKGEKAAKAAAFFSQCVYNVDEIEKSWEGKRSVKTGIHFGNSDGRKLVKELYTGVKAGLKNGEFLTLHGDGVKYYGGNQEWFSGFPAPYDTIAELGCGDIAGCNVLLYLAGQNPQYQNELTKAAEKGDKEGYMEFVKKITDQYLYPPKRPIVSGLTGFEIAWGMNRYFKDYKIPLGSYWSMEKEILPHIVQMLEQDIPVILSIGPLVLNKKTKWVRLKEQDMEGPSPLQKGKRDQTTSDHYVTVTEIEGGGEGAVLLTLSSWGKKFAMDYDELMRYRKEELGGRIVTNVLVIKPV